MYSALLCSFRNAFRSCAYLPGKTSSCCGIVKLGIRTPLSVLYVTSMCNAPFFCCLFFRSAFIISPVTILCKKLPYRFGYHSQLCFRNVAYGCAKTVDFLDRVKTSNTCKGTVGDIFIGRKTHTSQSHIRNAVLHKLWKPVNNFHISSCVDNLRQIVRNVVRHQIFSCR